MSGSSRIVAVLGPTNTGKTHYAIERMLGHRTGVIGLPLRLLAREVYDKIVAIRGPSVVALVTGEERIVPPRAQYWVCTVEAMPEGMGADFVAIDEIQLCAIPNVAMCSPIACCVHVGPMKRCFWVLTRCVAQSQRWCPRRSLFGANACHSWFTPGSKKISRMPAAQCHRRVLGGQRLCHRRIAAPSERVGRRSLWARSARVRGTHRSTSIRMARLTILVATDAIGMGLNLDVNHVAFSSLTKFDGRRMRPLAPNELAQIAGRAGRGMSDGTFRRDG